MPSRRDTFSRTRTKPSSKFNCYPPRYERYRLPDIPWIEEVPAGWKVQRLKTIFQLVTRPVRDEDEIITAFRDGEVKLRNKKRQEGFTNALQEIGCFPRIVSTLGIVCALVSASRVS